MKGGLRPPGMGYYNGPMATKPRSHRVSRSRALNSPGGKGPGLFALIGGVARRFREERFPQLAASLAYTTLLSLVPLVTMIVVALSFLPIAAVLVRQVNRFLVANLLPERAGAAIAEYTLTFSQNASNLTLLGLGFLVLTAWLLLLEIEGAFNHVWGVVEKRNVFQRLKLYSLLLLVGPLVLGAVFGVTSFAVSTSLGLLDEPQWVRQVAFKVTSVMLLTGFFALLYYAVPHTRVVKRHALVGGLLASVGVTAMQRGFEVYLTKFATFTLVYGAFSAVPIFLLWLYLSWAVVLVGALVAAGLDGARGPGRR